MREQAFETSTMTVRAPASQPPIIPDSFRGAGGTLAISAVLAAFEYEVIQAREKMRSELGMFLGEIQQGAVLTRKEAAQYIGCGLTKFDSLVKGGRIKVVSYDEHARFRRETLDQFLKENER
jgi:excisionase family DNA binding protein